MSWKRGMMKDIYAPTGDDILVPALVNDGAAIAAASDEALIEMPFRYKSAIARTVFPATRFFGTSELTDTWVVNINAIRRDVRNASGDEFLQVHEGAILRDIQEALLADPTWPVDYGRPDMPARSVQFRDDWRPEYSRAIYEP